MEEFLQHTCEKAGLARDTWKNESVKIEKFEGIIFKEETPNGDNRKGENLMEVRTPAVSGTFYPGDEKELKDLIHECFLHELGPGKIPPTDSDQKIYGVICPHAGFVYSGPVACHSFYSISSSTSKLAIITGPNPLRNWSKCCING